MEQITKPELIELIETGHIYDYLGTFDVQGELRAFYRSTSGAALTGKPYKLVYVIA